MKTISLSSIIDYNKLGGIRKKIFTVLKISRTIPLITFKHRRWFSTLIIYGCAVLTILNTTNTFDYIMFSGAGVLSFYTIKPWSLINKIYSAWQQAEKYFFSPWIFLSVHLISRVLPHGFYCLSLSRIQPLP